MMNAEGRFLLKQKMDGVISSQFQYNFLLYKDSLNQLSPTTQESKIELETNLNRLPEKLFSVFLNKMYQAQDPESKQSIKIFLQDQWDCLDEYLSLEIKNAKSKSTLSWLYANLYEESFLFNKYIGMSAKGTEGLTQNYLKDLNFLSQAGHLEAQRQLRSVERSLSQKAPGFPHMFARGTSLHPLKR